VGWNEPAADALGQFRAQRIRIGTQDLKIAAIALANDALLLSANLRDFEQVPNLRIENWLSERPGDSF
jgi:tRNA(fMet)-specific endonuclease VapC